ncbi:hypothetical protein T439DRAFT_325225, partial [Meredithblackwellia eburnea MCA 4105]
MRKLLDKVVDALQSGPTLESFTHDDTAFGMRSIVWNFLKALGKKKGFPETFGIMGDASFLSRTLRCQTLPTHREDPPSVVVNLTLPKFLEDTEVAFKVESQGKEFTYVFIQPGASGCFGDQGEGFGIWGVTCKPGEGTHPFQNVFNAKGYILIHFERPLATFLTSSKVMSATKTMFQELMTAPPGSGSVSSHSTKTAAVSIKKEGEKTGECTLFVEDETIDEEVKLLQVLRQSDKGSREIVVQGVTFLLARVSSKDHAGCVDPLFSICIKKTGRAKTSISTCPWMNRAFFEVKGAQQAIEDAVNFCYSVELENLLSLFLARKEALRQDDFVLAGLKDACSWPFGRHTDKSKSRTSAVKCIRKGILSIDVLEGCKGDSKVGSSVHKLQSKACALNSGGYVYYFQSADPLKSHTNSWVIQKVVEDNNPHWPSWLKTVLVSIKEHGMSTRCRNNDVVFGGGSQAAEWQSAARDWEQRNFEQALSQRDHVRGLTSASHATATAATSRTNRGTGT